MNSPTLQARTSLRARCRRMAFCAALLATSLRAAPAQVAEPPLVPVTLVIGFTTTVFVQSNRNDLEAAFKALAGTIGLERGFRVTVKTRFYPNPEAFQEAVAAGLINFAIVDSLAFVAQPPDAPGDLPPVFVAASEGTSGRRYLLLVRRDSGLRTLADLRGKSIVELQAPTLSVGHTWLQNLLLTHNEPDEEAFFSSIEHVAKPSAAVLPVFFGSRDACLVDDLGFKLMQELNPQVGAQLQTLETSLPMVGAIVCASELNWVSPQFRPALLQALGELHLTPAGRQILTLFKISQLVPYEETRIDTVRELWSSYLKLSDRVLP